MLFVVFAHVRCISSLFSVYFSCELRLRLLGVLAGVGMCLVYSGLTFGLFFALVLFSVVCFGLLLLLLFCCALIGCFWCVDLFLSYFACVLVVLVFVGLFLFVLVYV